MSDRRKSTDCTPQKKPSRWRFGRRKSTSKTESTSSATSGEMSPPVRSPSQHLPPSPPVSPPAGAPDARLRALVHSLSLKDDPSQFGEGTLAARRMQREELDAAMARNLFSRELAMVPQRNSTPPAPSPEQQGSARTPVAVDLRPLMHLRPAFTEQGWKQFTADPLRYIHTHGLPQEVQVVEREVTTRLVQTPTRPVSTPSGQPRTQPQQPERFILPPEPVIPGREQLILPVEAQPAPCERLILPAELVLPGSEQFSPDLESQSPASPTDATPTSPSKGLTTTEISRVLTTFSQRETVKSDKDPKKRPSRIRGRKMPKGAKTKGIISEEEANECSICLVDFEAGQRVGLLPCCHRFHAECVIDWLGRDGSCPECREELRSHLH